MQHIRNYINGQLVAPESNQHLDNFCPSTGKVYSHIPDSDEKDVERAYQAAASAFGDWSVTPAEKRSRYLLKIASLIEKNIERLAIAESIDNGKPLKLARAVDIPRASANFQIHATAILHYASQSHIMEDTSINFTLRHPGGVAGCISPWNLPLYLFSWKIAP